MTLGGGVSFPLKWPWIFVPGEQTFHTLFFGGPSTQVSKIRIKVRPLWRDRPGTGMMGGQCEPSPWWELIHGAWEKSIPNIFLNLNSSWWTELGQPPIFCLKFVNHVGETTSGVGCSTSIKRMWVSFKVFNRGCQRMSIADLFVSHFKCLRFHCDFISFTLLLRLFPMAFWVKGTINGLPRCGRCLSERPWIRKEMFLLMYRNMWLE